MFTWIRSNQRTLMLIVTVLTILAFVVLFNMGSLETIGRSDFTKIFGRTVTVTELQREARLAQLAQGLGLGQYVAALTAGSPENAEDFVLNAIVLRHEARELGVQPTTNEIKNAIAALPVFQTNGQFDPQKYLAFSERYLAPLGFTEAQIEEVVSDSLRFDRIRTLIESPVVVTDLQLRQFARLFAKARGQVVIFNQQDYMENIDVPEAMVVAEFEKRAPQLNTQATRAVRYVTFSLPAESASLAGAERTKALQAVADASADFADKAAAGSFEQAAKDAGLTPTTTLDFSSQGQVSNPAGITEAGAGAGDPTRVLARPAFLLTTDSPVTGVIQDGDNFYVAELVRETPARPMTLEEARPEIAQSIRFQTAQARLEEAAVSGLATLREAQAAGRPFAEAAAAANLKVSVFDVAPLDDSAPADQRQFAEAAYLLEPGEMSQYVPRGGGGFAVLLEAREPFSDSQIADKREQIVNFLKTQHGTVLFFDWLNAVRERAGVPRANG